MLPANRRTHAEVVELVDMAVSNSFVLRRAGSIPGLVPQQKQRLSQQT